MSSKRLLPCGKRYASEAEAKASPRGAEEGASVYQCWGRDCGGWHVRPATPPARAVPSRPRRETGFPPAVKLAARARAGGGDPEAARCENCGRWLGLRGGQVQHRVARGIGGSRSPVVNGICNAGLLCGTPFSGCHGACEKRDKKMQARGWWIKPGKGLACDPRLVAVILAGGRQAWLGEDGTYLDKRPAVAA